GQIQVNLKFKRLQYIAYEPVVATLAITNLAGRDIELHDSDGQSWLGFEITGNEGQPIAPLNSENAQPPLKIEAGQRVTRQIDLGLLYPVHDFGAYHVRTHVHVADLGKFFYSGTRVFDVTDARPILFTNRLEWPTAGTLVVHGNQNPASSCPFGKWRSSSPRRRD